MIRRISLVALLACHGQTPGSHVSPPSRTPSANVESTETATPTADTAAQGSPWGGSQLLERSGLPTGDSSHIFVNRSGSEALYLRHSDFHSFVGFRSLCGQERQALSAMNENYDHAVASPNLERVLTARDGVVELWDTRSARQLGSWSPETVVSLASSDDIFGWVEESRVVLVQHDGQVRARHAIDVERGAWPAAFALSNDGALFAVAWSEWADVYDAGSGRRIQRIRTPDAARAIRFEARAQRVLLSTDMRIIIANPRTGAIQRDIGTGNDWWGTDVWFVPGHDEVYYGDGLRMGFVNSEEPEPALDMHRLDELRFVDEHVLAIGDRQIRYLTDGHARTECIASLPPYPRRIVPQEGSEADVVRPMGHFVRWDFARGVATGVGRYERESPIPSDERFATLRERFPEGTLIDHVDQLDRAIIYNRAQGHLVQISDGSTVANFRVPSEQGRYFHGDWFMAWNDDYSWSRRRTSDGERLDAQRYAAESVHVIESGAAVLDRETNLVVVAEDGSEFAFRPPIMGRFAVGEREVAVLYWEDEDSGALVKRLSLPALEELATYTLDSPVELLQYLPANRLVAIGGGEAIVLN